MFNIFKRKTDLDIIAQHFNEEARVKAQCDATIHAALFSRYLTVTRMTALADWAKMTDAEKLAACNVQPDELPAPVVTPKKRLFESAHKKMVVVDEHRIGGDTVNAH